MGEAREELFGILESVEMRGVPVVVVANKQDLPGKLIVLQLKLTHAHAPTLAKENKKEFFMYIVSSDRALVRPHTFVEIATFSRAAAECTAPR